MQYASNYPDAKYNPKAYIGEGQFTEGVTDPELDKHAAFVQRQWAFAAQNEFMRSPTTFPRLHPKQRMNNQIFTPPAPGPPINKYDGVLGSGSGSGVLPPYPFTEQVSLTKHLGDQCTLLLGFLRILLSVQL